MAQYMSSAQDFGFFSRINTLRSLLRAEAGGGASPTVPMLNVIHKRAEVQV